LALNRASTGFSLFPVHLLKPESLLTLHCAQRAEEEQYLYFSIIENKISDFGEETSR
jgi:hypothetical protein